MAPRFLTILTGRPADRPPVNEGAVTHFARILEKMGILKPNESGPEGP
jgi:hypothetical protein